MSFNKCPKCGHDVSGEAQNCPNCGYPIAELRDGEPQADKSNDQGELNAELNSRYTKVLKDLNAKRFRSAFAEVDALIKEYPNSHSFTELREQVVSEFVKSCVEDSDICLKEKNYKDAKAIARLGLEHDPSNPYLLNVINRVRKRKVMKRNIALFFLLLIAAGAGYAYYMLKVPSYNSKKEEEAWSLVMKYRSDFDADRLEDALDDYISDFDSGLHSAEAKALYESLVREKAAWKSAVRQNNALAMHDFMDQFGNGFFHKVAYQKLDSLSFYEAKNKNTKEAIDYYIDTFSDGKYVEEALAISDKLNNGNLTLQERETVKTVLDNHFQALADNDEELLRTTIGETINSYLGKTDLLPEDVVDYMNSLYEQNGADGGFYTVHNLDIKKLDDPGAPLIYNAQFNLTHTKVSMDGDEIRKEYAATATVDEKKHILSLILRNRETTRTPAADNSDTDAQSE